MTTSRLRRTRGSRGAGISCWRPVRRATHPSLSGQTAQSGLRRTHHCRSQVHNRLRIHRDVVLWRAAFGELPEALDCCGVGRKTRHSEEACKHALGVAVENREWFTAAQREDGARRGSADSRQCHELGEAARKIAAKFIADAPRCLMQMARPANSQVRSINAVHRRSQLRPVSRHRESA